MYLEENTKAFIDKGLIKKENIRNEQILEHLKRSNKDIKTSIAIMEIDEEAAFNYAYLAMLRAGRALMFSFGYRPIDGSQHRTVGEFAKIAMGTEAKIIIDMFDAMRRKRNQFTYDPCIPVSKNEAADAIKYAQRFLNYAIPKIIEQKPEIENKILGF